MPICNACEILKYDQLVNAKTRETGIRIYPPNPFPLHTCDELKETQYEKTFPNASELFLNEEPKYKDCKDLRLAELDNEDSELHCITEKCVVVFSNPALPIKTEPSHCESIILPRR
jgi:hypothetical protein